MVEDITIRPYLKGDEEEIVDLLLQVFNDWPHFNLTCNTIDHWKWKFTENLLIEPIVSLAIHNHRIIGFYHVLPQKLKIGERTILGGLGVDVGVQTDYRGKGLYSQIKQSIKKLEIEAGIEFHYSVDSNPILIKQSKRQKSSPIPFGLEKMIRISDIDLHLKYFISDVTFFKKYGFKVLKILNNAKQQQKFQNDSRDDVKITEIKRFDERIDAFWSKTREQFEFTVERNRGYLNWRFCDPRGGDFVVKIAEEQGLILGYIVLRINSHNPDYPLGFIVDLVTLPGYPQIAEELAFDAIKYFDKNRINYLTTNTIRGSLQEALFHRLGFINDVSKPFLSYSSNVKGNDLGQLNKLNVEHMNYAYGDYDHI